MIPTIEKLKLKDLVLSCGAKGEAISILSMRQNIRGFKFSIRGNKCVAVGRGSDNDFDYFDVAGKIQFMMEQRGRVIPDRFRFVLLS